MEILRWWGVSKAKILKALRMELNWGDLGDSNPKILCGRGVDISGITHYTSKQNKNSLIPLFLFFLLMFYKKHGHLQVSQNDIKKSILLIN